MTFKTIVTEAGQVAIADAVASGGTVIFQAAAVGDGGGSATSPQSTDTALVNETSARVSINEISTIGNQITVEFIIPASDGGYTVREAAVFDASGDMVMVANLSASEKPAPGEGGGKQLIVRMVATVQDATVINITVDESTVTATKEWVKENSLQTVATLAELNALTGMTTNDVRDVIGIGQFQYDGSEWIPISRPLTPEMFGAVRDGITDDGPAIQAAIDFLETDSAFTSGGVIQFRKGYYKSSPIYTGQSGMRSRITLRGEGITTIIELIDGADADLLTIGNGYNLIENIQLDGNRDNQSAGSVISTSANSGDFTKLHKVRIANGYDYGLEVVGIGQMAIDSSYFFGNGRGMYVGNSYVHVYGRSTFEDNKDGGIFYKGSGSFSQLLITGGRFENNAADQDTNTAHIICESIQAQNILGVYGSYFTGQGALNDTYIAAVEYITGNNKVEGHVIENNSFRLLGRGSVLYTAITDSANNSLKYNTYNNTDRPESYIGFYRDETHEITVRGTEIDLSASATTSSEWPLQNGRAYLVNDLLEVYTEATSADAGVTIRVGRTGAAATLYSGTSEKSTAAGTIIDRTSAMSAQTITPGSSGLQLTTGNAAAKTGAGQVEFIMKLTAF